MVKISVLLIIYIFSANAQTGNQKISNFSKAKKLLFDVHGKSGKTIYCQCDYNNKKISHQNCGYKSDKMKKRSTRLEWEHIVPAHAFGQSFLEWRNGDPKCKSRKKSYKGRKCAAKVSEQFQKMEADLYNLFPAVGSINGMRSNFSMAQALSDKGKIFGKCEVKIENRKIEPPDSIKGNIARIYQYMEASYPGRGIISNKNKPMFEAWDKLDPIDEQECEWSKKVEAIQGNKNIFACNKLIKP